MDVGLMGAGLMGAGLIVFGEADLGPRRRPLA